MIDLLDGKAVYERLDDLRAVKGWTLYELAKQANVSTSTIYHWRDRLTLPSLELLEAVCYALGITVIDFIADGDDMTLLTKEQKELVQLWSALSDDKKKSIINLMKSMQY